MRNIPHGITTTNRFDPTSRDTAAAVGNAGVEAVATVALILWIEATCGELMAPYLEAGEASVGFRVAVDHTGAAFAGRPVEVHARISGVAGRKVTFAVRLEQDGREVMAGEHVRAVVELARFLRSRAESAGSATEASTGPPTDLLEQPSAGSPEKPSPGSPEKPSPEPSEKPPPEPPDKPLAGTTDKSSNAPSEKLPAGSPDEPSTGSPGEPSTEPAVKSPVTFFFDVHSPWSYLASALIRPLARRHDAPIVWRPLHLANLMEQIGGMRPLEQTPARVAWYRQDIADRMALHGLAYDPHPDYPLRPSRALRSCVYAAEQGCADVFVGAVMRCYWSEKKDISDLAVLQAMADEVGLGPRPIAEIVEDESYKAAIHGNTDDAIALGVFGVPSFLFEGKLFFGSDRMDLLDSVVGSWTG